MRNVLTVLILITCWHFAAAQSSTVDSLKIFNLLDSTFRATNGTDPAAEIALVARLETIAKFLKSDTLLLKTTANRARLMTVLGFRQKATEEYYKTLTLAKKLNHPNLEAKANYELGGFYQQLGDFKRSSEYFKRAHHVAISNGVYEDTTLINCGIAENMALTGQVQEGIQLLKANAEGAIRKEKYVEAYGALESLAFVYCEHRQNSKSLDCLREVEPFADKINSNVHKTTLYVHLAEMSVTVDQLKEAEKYLDSAFKYVRIINSPEWLYECYKVKSRVAGTQGRYKEAMNAYETFSRYKDTVYRKDYNNKVAALTATYEFEKKQSEIALLQKDNALRKIKIDQQKMQRDIILLTGLLLIVILVASFRGWMNVKTKNLQKAFSRTLLKIQESDKQRIASELHDSIGQNILFIKNQISKQPDSENKERMIETITETIEEVRTISKELYPNQLEKYGLAAAVNALADKTTNATGIFVSASIEDIEQMLTKESKINCYRIIQESISNAVKHARARAVRITGSIQKSKIVLTILDNGTGFDTSLRDKKAQSSFGVLSMEARAKILNGKMEMETSSKGTKVTVTFPILNYAV